MSQLYGGDSIGWAAFGIRFFEGATVNLYYAAAIPFLERLDVKPLGCVRQPEYREA